MSTSKGTQLAQAVRQKKEVMSALCKGLDEKIAATAPADRWSPKQILSHLCGPEGSSKLSTIRTILEQDTPLVDLKAENPFFTEKRSKMTMAELLSEFETGYLQIADLVKNLSDEQLARKAHIPLFKDTPFGEYPTLGMFVDALAEHHMEFHINQMREILQTLGVKPGK
jgi:hypothetical protein